MKPSNISWIVPKDNVFNSPHHATIARNIAVTLNNNGNRFRRLKWDEYVRQIMKDMGITNPNHPEVQAHKPFFIQVLPYLVSAKKARTFSPFWNLQPHNTTIEIIR